MERNLKKKKTLKLPLFVDKGFLTSSIEPAIVLIFIYILRQSDMFCITYQWHQYTMLFTY